MSVRHSFISKRWGCSALWQNHGEKNIRHTGDVAREKTWRCEKAFLSFSCCHKKKGSGSCCVESELLGLNCQWCWNFSGASGERFQRPESVWYALTSLWHATGSLVPWNARNLHWRTGGIPLWENNVQRLSIWGIVQTTFLVAFSSFILSFVVCLTGAFCVVYIAVDVLKLATKFFTVSLDKSWTQRWLLGFLRNDVLLHSQSKASRCGLLFHWGFASHAPSSSAQVRKQEISLDSFGST